MEPMEVIDLSSDDEKTPPKKRNIQSSVNVSQKRQRENSDLDDLEIVYNSVKKQKQTIKTADQNRLEIQKTKSSQPKCKSQMVSKLHREKNDIAVKKLHRVKPEILSPQCSLKFSVSEATSESSDKCSPSAKPNGNADSSHDNDSHSEKETLLNSEVTHKLFRINEGASSSVQTNQLRLAVKNKVPIIETTGILSTPSKEMIESFFDACRKQDSSKDMEIIISKLRKRYNNLQPSYLKSGRFIELLRRKKDSISNDHTRLYFHITEVMDEMKIRQNGNRPSAKNKNKHTTEDAEKSTQMALDDTQNKDENVMDIEDQKCNKKLATLEKMMARCERRIHKYEMAEVDFENENEYESYYILTEKYKHRMVELYNKYCELTEERADAARPYLRPKHFSVTQLPSLDNAITSFINSKIMKMNKSLTHSKKKSGSSQLRLTDALIFPDYVDILNCIRKCNDEQNLGFTKAKQETLAKNAFTELGQHLKRCRQADYYDTFSLFLEKGGSNDPALTDKSLNEQLNRNQELGKKKMDQIFQEYVEKENAAKAIKSDSSLAKEEDQNISDNSSYGTDDKDSNPNDNEETSIEVDSDTKESNTLTTIAEKQDDLNETDSVDVESDKPKDGLSIKCNENVEQHKPEEDLNKKSNGNEATEPSDKQLHDTIKKRNNDKSEEDLTQNIDLNKLRDGTNKNSNNDKPEDNLTQEMSVDVDLNKSQDISNKNGNNNKPAEKLDEKICDNDDLTKLKDDINKKSDNNKPEENLNPKICDNIDLDKPQNDMNKESNDDKPEDNLTQQISDNNDLDKLQDDVITKNNFVERDARTDIEQVISKNEESHEVLNSLSVDCVEVSSTTTICDIKVTKQKDTEIQSADSSLHQKEISGLQINRIKIGEKESETTDPNNTKNGSSTVNFIEEVISTVATCKLNLIQEMETPETNLVDRCSSPTSVNDTKVIDAPAMVTTVEPIDRQEEKRPLLRLNHFAKPPGSWKDFQEPKTVIKIDKNRKIIAPSSTSISLRVDKGETSRNSNSVQTSQIPRPQSVSSHAIRMIGQNITGTSLGKKIIYHRSTNIDANGKRTIFRLVTGSKSAKMIVTPVNHGAMPNQRTHKPNRRSNPNCNSTAVTDSKTILKDLNKTIKTFSPHRTADREKVDDTSSDGVPTYVID